MIASIARPAFVVFASLALTSCVSVQLISKYDERTDEAASALQKQMTQFLVGISSEPDPEQRSFKNSLGFYRQAVVDFAALEVRARALDKNSITIRQIDATQDNLAWLILMHKGCISAPLDEAQRTKVRDQGPDLSLGCRTSYGATSDAPDRGDIPLSPLVARAAQRQFDQQLGGILALELAKKRGEAKKD